MEADLEAAKEREKSLPLLAKALLSDIVKEQSNSFKTTTADPMNKMMEDLRTRIEDLSKQGASDREALDARMLAMVTENTELLKDARDQSVNMFKEQSNSFKTTTSGSHEQNDGRSQNTNRRS